MEFPHPLGTPLLYSVATSPFFPRDFAPYRIADVFERNMALRIRGKASRHALHRPDKDVVAADLELDDGGIEVFFKIKKYLT
ncbi:MAG: hypothetical protein A2W19_15360 [Spirochaetes bacterium RBG_16_49_21]|nr:MAG: hypothetical protein A2W19_15360 [Spirochaetes bacterium RBG_16_49_21]